MSCQHGFMKEKSTETAVFELRCKILESPEKGEVSENHKILL